MAIASTPGTFRPTPQPKDFNSSKGQATDMAAHERMLAGNSAGREAKDPGALGKPKDPGAKKPEMDLKTQYAHDQMKFNKTPKADGLDGKTRYAMEQMGKPWDGGKTPAPDADQKLREALQKFR